MRSGFGRKALATLRSGGVRALIWQALAAAGVRRLTVYWRPSEAPLEPPPDAGVSVRLLSEADLDAYHDLRPDSPPGETERRLGAGDRCFCGWREGRLAGVYWVATREAPVHYLGLSVPLHDGAWFAYDAFIATEERRRGIHHVLRNEAVILGRSEGSPALLAAILPENHGGSGLVKRSRRLGTLASIRIGPLRLARSSAKGGYLGEPRFS
jgi:hypothetical protein